MLQIQTKQKTQKLMSLEQQPNQDLSQVQNGHDAPTQFGPQLPQWKYL